jgi:Mn-dependent DtxR family transcriptional regulator
VSEQQANVRKVLLQVLEVLEDGPATSEDVAHDLAISRKTASAYLSDLFSQGLLTRVAMREERESSLLQQRRGKLTAFR